jgi:hypothetical protein
LIEGLASSLNVEHSKDLDWQQFNREMSEALPGAGANRWGIKITSPSEDAIVPRKITVRGVIEEPLSPGQTLRLLRVHPNHGGFAPGGDVHVRNREWESLGFDLGGEPGTRRGIEAWVVGRDGNVLLDHWKESFRVHSDLNHQLRRVTGSYGEWLPYLQSWTRDMIRCARVLVMRQGAS